MSEQAGHLNGPNMMDVAVEQSPSESSLSQSWQASSLRDMPLPDRYQALKNKRVLITGAAGFIGGALLRRLHAYGIKATGTVLYEREDHELRNAGLNARVLDLASNEPWDEILRDIDVVFHIAAMFQETEHSERVYDKINHKAVVKLAQAAARMGAERFVHCSTIGVHGDVKEIPATEATPFNPMDGYHRTKLKGELAVLDFARSLPPSGMVVTVNRPSMVYGPGDMRLLKLFKSILSQKFYMIGSGETLAHLGYIDDQTDSFLQCAIAPREQVHCEAFNIASAKPLTLNRLASTIANIGGVPLSSLKVPLAPVMAAGIACEWLCKPFAVRPPLSRRRIGFFTHNRAFDLTKAKEQLGYQSQWSHEKGLTETVSWYRRMELV